MAWTISKAGNKVIQLCKEHAIILDNEIEQQLKNQRYIKFSGYNCLVANVMGSSTFRVRINTAWFKHKTSEKLKPKLTTFREGFDFQLIPTRKTLYVLYYQALKDYTMQLEVDKERWFKEPWWGIEVNEKKGAFVWKGGNTIQFPLTPFQSLQALSIREKQYLILKEMAT